MSETETQRLTEKARTIVVHNLPPMTTAELAVITCGHCAHRLTYHVTDAGGATGCGICHCLRSPSEDIRDPHRFLPGKGEFDD